MFSNLGFMTIININRISVVVKGVFMRFFFLNLINAIGICITYITQ